MKHWDHICTIAICT